jgi:hypothetical protein
VYFGTLKVFLLDWVDTKLYHYLGGVWEPLGGGALADAKFEDDGTENLGFPCPGERVDGINGQGLQDAMIWIGLLETSFGFRGHSGLYRSVHGMGRYEAMTFCGVLSSLRGSAI